MNLTIHIDNIYKAIVQCLATLIPLWIAGYAWIMFVWSDTRDALFWTVIPLMVAFSVFLFWLIWWVW